MESPANPVRFTSRSIVDGSGTGADSVTLNLEKVFEYQKELDDDDVVYAKDHRDPKGNMVVWSQPNQKSFVPYNIL